MNIQSQMKHLLMLALLITAIGCDSAERYTITLAHYTHAEKKNQAAALLTRAKAALNTNDVWLDQDDDGVSVNYGHFPTSRKGSRGHRELQRVLALETQLQTGPYFGQFSVLTRLPEPDPPAKASWNLLTRSCQYTLEIAVYFDVPEKHYFTRKADAVQQVRKLREADEQAYFVHGKFESRVYVKCLSAADVMSTNAQGQTVLRNTPLMRRLRQQYKFRLENTQRVYTIVRDPYGKRDRLAHRPKLLDVAAMQKDVTF